MSYSGVTMHGRGIASRMHDRRIGPVEDAVGCELYPGTLNVSLSRAFDWGATHRQITVPDAADWNELDGEWRTGTLRLYPVAINGLAAWVMRLDRSRAPLSLVEIVAPVRLRDMVDGPVTLDHA